MDAVYLYNKYGSPIAYDVWTSSAGSWVGSLITGRGPTTASGRSRRTAELCLFESAYAGSHWIGRCVWPTKRSLRSTSLALALSAQRDLRNDHDQRLGCAPHLRAVLRHRGARRLQPDHAAGLLHLADRPTDARHVGANHGGTCLGQPGVSLRGRKGSRRRADRAEGTFNMCTFWLVEALTRDVTWSRRATFSKRCSPMPIISVWMLKKSVRAARRWGISRRRLRT